MSQPDDLSEALRKATSEAIRRGASAYVAGLALEAPKPTYPVTQGDEPIRALKGAYLMLSGSGVEFASLNQFGHHFGVGQRATYGPKAQAACRCVGSDTLSSAYNFGYVYRNHQSIEPDAECGFYAWKERTQFPWQPGTWLLEVDLYGRVIEHEFGYRAARQRVLRISPVVSFPCEPPLHLVANMEDRYITADCRHASHQREQGHPVSVEQLRRILNVEVDLDWATQMRSGQ